MIAFSWAMEIHFLNICGAPTPHEKKNKIGNVKFGWKQYNVDQHGQVIHKIL